MARPVSTPENAANLCHPGCDTFLGQTMSDLIHLLVANTENNVKVSYTKVNESYTGLGP